MRPARLALLALCGAALACRRPATGVGPYSSAPVVLVSIDTLRADHLPLYGYKAGSAPNLDALAREGVVFEDVYSHCPLTLPAHASIFTGLLPTHHGVRDNIGFTLKEPHRTLAERFKAAGWVTGGAVSAYVLRNQTGISRGFEFYDDALEMEAPTEALGSVQRDGAVAVESLLRWIAGQEGRRFFAFLHLYEPHSPYSPPERHRGHALAYDGEVSYADELVGTFVEGLRRGALFERSVFVVTSDHGEGLKDHGEQEHGIFLYRESVHVPLILRLPGGALGGRRVAGTVAQVDLAPTLLELAGLSADGMDGRSLRAQIAGGSGEPRPVYSETLFPRYHFGWSDLYSVTEARFRYIRAPRPELYDVGRDPGERENLVGSRPTAAAAMSGWLDEQVGQVAPPEEVPAETKEKLQALGYVGGGTARVAEGELPDPKDKVGSYEDLRRGMALRQRGQDAEAVAQLRRVLETNRGMLDAWELLGTTLIRMGREKEGIAALHEALNIEPNRSATHLALAKVYGLDNKMDLATRHAQQASAGDPGQGFEALAQIMLDQGRLEQAVQFARKSLASDPQRVMSNFVLGVAAQRRGRHEEALAFYLRAAEYKERVKRSVVRNLHANMADCLARLGREAEAEKEFRAEIQAIPASREARVGLTMLYRSQGRDAEARAVLSGLVEDNPRASADTYLTVVRTFTVLGDLEAARDWTLRAQARFPGDPRFR